MEQSTKVYTVMKVVKSLQLKMLENLKDYILDVGQTSYL